MAARRKYTKGRANAQAKSMKMDAAELMTMVSDAVTKALDEREAEKDDSDGGNTDSVADVIAAAVESVNEKRKSGDEVSEIPEGDVDELLEAIAEAEEGKSDDEDFALEDIVQAAADAVNEKRKSRKEDGLNDDDLTDILDAVEEIMSDEDAGGDAKARKASTVKRQTKGRVTKRPQRAVSRKYSSIYMTNAPARENVERKKIPAGILLARSIKCIDVFGRNDPERAAFYAKKNYGDEDMAREFKALTATGPSNGGYLIPEVYMDQIVEMLYPKTVIFDLGAQKVPLDGGNLNIPKMTAGTRATWGGEQRRITKTEPTFGNIKLSAKRLGAIVPQSKELIMSTSYSADALFANDLTRRMQLGLDFGGMYGTGGEFMPTGIYNTKGVEKVDAGKLSNADLADSTGKITADFPVWLRAKAMNKNIDDVKLGWAFNSITEAYIMNMKTTTGAYIYREEMQAGKLLGSPYRISNQIPVSADGTTDIFFGNWADLLIGDQMGMETLTTLEGSWIDDEGTQHSAFDENLVATRATMYDDIAVRHEESFIIAKKVKVM